MKLKDYRETYYEYTRKSSEVVRHLSLAGLALVWVSTQADKKGITIPADLRNGGIWLAVSIAIDLFHCLIGSFIWAFVTRSKENEGVDPDEDFSVHRSVNWPALWAFWLKAVSLIGAYFYILRYFLGIKVG